MTLGHPFMALWSSWSGLFVGLPNGDLLAGTCLLGSVYLTGLLIKKVFGAA